MIKAIFFDLDGTLLPMDEKKFTEGYFGILYKTVKDHGYEDLDKMVATIWGGTKRMMMNDGSKTNEKAFWDYFASVYGQERLKDIPLFDAFYDNQFKASKMFCGENPLAHDIVDYARKHFDKVILSTNPIFPYVGTRTRLSFIGLKPEDFDYVTTYENCSYSKPNPKYFQQLLEKFDLKPEEVHLFGNNTREDGDCSQACGIDCTLIKGNIIYDPKATGTYPEITMDQVIPTMESLLS